MKDEIRNELSVALQANAARLRDAIRLELDRITELEPDQRVQFEIDPNFYGVSCCATEEEVLPDGWLEDALPEGWIERAGEAFDGWDALVADALSTWFADVWRDLDGKARFRPAFLFFHGYHRRQFDLELRAWLEGDALDARWG